MDPFRPRAGERRDGSRLEAARMRLRRRLRQSRARIQPFQGLAPDFSGEPRAAKSPGRDVCIPQRRSGEAGRSVSPGGPRFAGADSTFSMLCGRFSGPETPAEAADRPFPPWCRGATHRVASRSRHEAAAPTAIPGADSTFSRPCARFCGRLSLPSRAAKTRPSSRSQGSSSSGLPFPRRFRAFSRRCGAIFDSR